MTGREAHEEIGTGKKENRVGGDKNEKGRKTERRQVVFITFSGM